MKTFYKVILLLVLSHFAFAQQSKFDSLIFESKKIKNPIERFLQLIKESKKLYFKDVDMSLKLTNEALKIAETTHSDSLKALTYVSLSYAYQLKDNADACMGFVLKALAIAEKVKLHPNDMAIIYRKLGYVYQKHQKFNAAIDAFKMAYNYSEKANNQIDMAGTLGGIGLLYLGDGKYDLALKYVNRAILLAKKIKQNDIILRNQINLIHIYDKLNDDKNAFKVIEEMDFWFDQVDATSFVKCLACTVVADFDLRKGNKNHIYAKNFLSKMDDLLKSTKVGNDNMTDYYLVKSLLEFSQGSEKEASNNLAKYHEYKNILENEILSGHSQELATKYETGKKDALIKNLNIEKELQIKKQELSDTQKKGAIILAVLLGILASLFYNRFRLKKKSSEELAIKNIEIEKQKEIIQTSLGEKETLLREIHHRVKNNLQIISSLLNIQSENISDPMVLSSIREGQSRVQAMSLIHQNLYQSDHLSNVDIENYLKELVVYLSEMFAKEGKNISVEVDANNINFDIDTAIPLGLIVNELVSNAYKYAFEQQESGKIKIGIKALTKTDYELKVDDDGKGLPTDFNLSKSKSLGLKLVKILSRQLRGQFSSNSSKGASFVVLFKDLRAFQQMSE